MMTLHMFRQFRPGQSLCRTAGPTFDQGDPELSLDVRLTHHQPRQSKPITALPHDRSKALATRLEPPVRRRAAAVVFTGDDFGLSSTNNQGIITAHTQGVLSTACLMVGGQAVDEAVRMAKDHPTLKVGLHISFSDTRPMLPPSEVPLLVQADGCFPPDDRAHKKALLSADGRRQIRAEIAAQFQAFQQTGLVCDHVNTHRHVHRNAVLAWILFQEASRWPVTTTRIPWDPPAGTLRKLRTWLLRRLAAAHGLRAPDRSIGRDWTPATLISLLGSLPGGTTELYFHPVTATNHRYAQDLKTLLQICKQTASSPVTIRHGLRDLMRYADPPVE